ncbi:DNA binding protein [Mycobacterium phage BirdsNest]|uniref:Helix-turn-helix DNA binding domain protein n=1 Tax=Mycobacterium phage BirdsNest TaxID=2686231 RepID=A0A6B9LF83_9CAUD|nr:DNA binding protein [Mycobacterium phage BirdsNest]QHB37395.1 helix-turn-helix DNA binding domain protein [Mycobacterium phage BirdsNest]
MPGNPSARFSPQAREAQRAKSLARRAEVRELWSQGATRKQIAEALGVGDRQVQRYLVDEGLVEKHGGKPPMTPEEVEKARLMLEDGASYWAVALTLGRDWATIRRRVPGFHVLSAQEKSERAVLGRQLRRLERRKGLGG